MPAIDLCEPQVINALQKDGWIVTHQPFAIRIDRKRGGYIYADLRLQNANQSESIIVVEVKCFDSTRTHLEDFYQAIGQCTVYTNALALNNIDTPVFLSIPDTIYQTFFQQTLIQSVIKTMQIQMVVIDLQKEEIVQWVR